MNTRRISLAALDALIVVAAGLVSPIASAAPARTLVVPRDYPSVQAAVDAAAPGTTIQIEAGTYTEQVVITKDVDIRGAGAGATIIKAPDTLVPFGTNVRNGRPVVAVVRVGRAAHVHMSDVTVSGPLPCALVTGVITIQGATLDLTDAVVRDILPAAARCAEPATGRAIGFGLAPNIEVDGVLGGNGFGRVSHVEVDGFQTLGLTANGTSNGVATNVTFTDNIVRPGSPVIATEQFAIDLEFGAVARVDSNTVTGAACTFDGCGNDPLTQFQSGGIIAAGAGASTVISGNHVSGADIGIYQLFSPDCCRIADNVVVDNRFFGIVIQDGNGATESNTILGGQVGIAVVADSVDTTALLRGDRIRSASVAAVREIDCCGYTATAVVSSS